MKYHMGLDVRGFLMSAKKRDFAHMFKHDDGRTMTPDEAKAQLLDELAKGHKFIPYGDCDNFDYENGGCKGHEA